MAPQQSLRSSWNALATPIQKSSSLAFGLAAVGGIYIAVNLFRFLIVLLQTFVLSGISLKRFGAKQGAWAVVTGATDGIGREFALQLAKAGFNVVLASRTESKLQAVASEIESQYGVSTITHAIDFSKRDNDAAFTKLRSVLAPLDIGVLINNVGKSHDMPVYFDECSDEEMNAILEINIHATLKVTKMVLPTFLQRKNGLILNLGSFSGAFASPMLATYSASKGFLSVFSQALADEYGSRGVVIRNINTYFVMSSMSKIRRSSMMVPTPKAYVRSVLSKIGLPCGAVDPPYTMTPYWSHSLMEYALRVLAMPKVYIQYAHNLHTDLRRRALKKKEREAAAAKKE